MKKKLLLVLLSCLLLTGCNKVVHTEKTKVEVTIVNSYHQDKITYPHYNTSTKTWTTKVHQYEENYVYVEYDGMEYTLSGEQYYRQFGHRIGEEVGAYLITKTYEDGTTKQEIIID